MVKASNGTQIFTEDEENDVKQENPETYVLV
jgi:hypothetical protein